MNKYVCLNKNLKQINQVNGIIKPNFNRNSIDSPNYKQKKDSNLTTDFPVHRRLNL